jgi:6,7-dimethyl-8-ribityllumazine synthase
MPDRIAFIHARWHAQIVDRGRHAFLDAVETLGVSRGRVDCFAVPGSYEIPLRAQRLAATGRYAAIVAAGLVVDGGIYRHEFVAEAVIGGLMRVQLDSGVPVVSMVLTPHCFHGHDAHEEFFRAHFKIKGAEAAAVCVEAMAEPDPVMP